MVKYSVVRWVVLAGVLAACGCSDDAGSAGGACPDGQAQNPFTGACAPISGADAAGVDAAGADGISADAGAADATTADGRAADAEPADDASAPGACVAGRRRCRQNQVVVCNADGTAQQVDTICGDDQVCEQGSCVADDNPCQQRKGYLGCDFLAADLDHMTPGDEQQFGLSVSNSFTEPVGVRVTDGDGTQVATSTVGVGELEVFELDRRDVDNTGLNRQSYLVETTGPVTVHQFNPLSRSGVKSTDASLLLPSTAIGTDYMVLGWPTTTSFRVTEGRAYFTVIAAKDDTEVTVTPAAAVAAGGGVAAIGANESRTKTLQRGQVWSLSTSNEAGQDLSGSTVSATKPVAVFSGSECADVPVGTAACDHLEQQLYPTSSWGTTFAAAKFAPRDQESDIYRVVASQDGTQLEFSPAVDGTAQTTIDRGEVYQFGTSEHVFVQASAPILLGQYMVGASDDGVCSGLLCLDAPGDPAFLLNVATRQYRQNYIVLVPTGFDQDFLGITAPTGANIQIDGQPVSSSAAPIAQSGWQVYQESVADGVHRVAADEPVGLSAYGYAQYVSYAYPGGLSLEAR